MFIDLNNLKIECKTCGVLTPVRQVRYWHEATWVVSFACESCEEKRNEQENKAIEDNYEDFVKNEPKKVHPKPTGSGFGNRKTIEEIVPRGRGGGRPLGSKDSAPRAVCRCSRCGTRGRRISSLRGGRCIACEHMDVIL